MSTHLKFKPDMDVPYLSRQGLGSTPAQVHYNAMRRIFPEKQITLLAEYLYTSDPEIRDMLVYLVNHHHAFNRKLNLDGTVEVVELWNQESPKLVDDFMRLKNAQIQAVLKGTPPDIEGPLASNQLNIMMLGIKAFLEKRQRGAVSKGEGKKFTAYAVSGRSMIHYTKNPKFQQEICAMYSILRERFTYLPEEIDVKMLPGSNLGFATAANEEPLELIKLIGRQNSRISETQEEIKSLSGDSQKTVISVVNGLRKELNNMIDQMWAIAPWETFYSQHDAICNGGKTIIPEEIKGMSFKKLGILIKPK
jgi:hypothetical protein